TAIGFDYLGLSDLPAPFVGVSLTHPGSVVFLNAAGNLSEDAPASQQGFFYDQDGSLGFLGVGRTLYIGAQSGTVKGSLALWTGPPNNKWMRLTTATSGTVGTFSTANRFTVTNAFFCNNIATTSGLSSFSSGDDAICPVRVQPFSDFATADLMQWLD